MRSKWKGNILFLKIYKLSYFKYKDFYKNLRKNYFKLSRSLFIYNFFNKLKFYTHDGRKWVFIYVQINKHFWKKLGEFFFTKKRSLYLSKRKLKKLKKKKKKK